MPKTGFLVFEYQGNSHVHLDLSLPNQVEDAPRGPAAAAEHCYEDVGVENSGDGHRILVLIRTKYSTERGEVSVDPLLTLRLSPLPSHRHDERGEHSNFLPILPFSHGPSPPKWNRHFSSGC